MSKALSLPGQPRGVGGWGVVGGRCERSRGKLEGAAQGGQGFLLPGHPTDLPACAARGPGLGLSKGFEPFLLTTTRFNSRPAMAWHRTACNGRSGWLGQTLAWQASAPARYLGTRLRSPQRAHGFSRAPGRMGNMGLSVSLTCQSPCYPLPSQGGQTAHTHAHALWTLHARYTNRGRPSGLG